MVLVIGIQDKSEIKKKMWWWKNFWRWGECLQAKVTGTTRSLKCQETDSPLKPPENKQTNKPIILLANPLTLA